MCSYQGPIRIFLSCMAPSHASTHQQVSHVRHLVHMCVCVCCTWSKACNNSLVRRWNIKAVVYLQRTRVVESCFHWVQQNKKAAVAIWSIQGRVFQADFFCTTRNLRLSEFSLVGLCFDLWFRGSLSVVLAVTSTIPVRKLQQIASVVGAATQ